MRNFILPPGGLFLFALAITFVVSIEAGVAYAIDNYTTVSKDVTCTVKSIDIDGGETTLKLNCNEKEAYTKKPAVIVNYIRSPGPLTCTTHKTGRANCELSNKEQQ